MIEPCSRGECPVPPVRTPATPASPGGEGRLGHPTQLFRSRGVDHPAVFPRLFRVFVPGFQVDLAADPVVVAAAVTLLITGAVHVDLRQPVGHVVRKTSVLRYSDGGTLVGQGRRTIEAG